MDVSHMPGELDAKEAFTIEDGYLKVTASRGNIYMLNTYIHIYILENITIKGV